jgi:hypothetical protein
MRCGTRSTNFSPSDPQHHRREHARVDDDHQLSGLVLMAFLVSERQFWQRV